MMPENIMLSVSSFSCSYDIATNKLDLEHFLKMASELGYDGVELVGGQIMPGYPYPSDDWVEQCKLLLDKYHLQLCAYGTYADLTRFSGRNQTHKEIVSQLRNDIFIASRLGSHVLKTNDQVNPEYLIEVIDELEKWNVWLGIELHEPNSIHDEVWQPFMELFKEYKGAYFGVVPDTGIFQHRPHEIFKRNQLESGIDEEFYEKLADSFEKCNDLLQTLDLCRNNEKAEMVARNIYATFGKNRINDLPEILKYCRYMHGKFHYINSNNQDKGIDFVEIIRIMKKCSFKGSISAEYEGYFRDTAIDTREQLKRYINMMHLILEGISNEDI